MIDAPDSFRKTSRSLPIALLRAREKVMGPIRDMLATSGVNEQKWRVLRVLDERGPLELNQIAHEACLLLPSLTRMVRPMEEEGLIERRTPQEDRRKSIFSITSEGKALVDKYMETSVSIFSDLDAKLGPERVQLLLDLLEELQALDLKSR